MAQILILEDDVLLSQTWTDWLDAAGHGVFAAHTRPAAEVACAERQFDLIISDFFIQDHEGKLMQDGAVTFITHLRSPSPNTLPRWTRTVPIIAITGTPRTEFFDALDQARALGATTTLRKPVSRETLLETVERFHRT
ncbi:MAG: response regulator [Myxococcota bacterium]